mgnify:CR=1 FL=1
MSLFKSALQTGIRLIKGGANQKKTYGTMTRKGSKGYPDKVESAGVVKAMAKRKKK